MAIAIDLVSLIVYSQFKKCGIPKAISSNKETERQVNDMFKIVFEWQEILPEVSVWWNHFIFHHQNINIVQSQGLSLNKI